MKLIMTQQDTEKLGLLKFGAALIAFLILTAILKPAVQTLLAPRPAVQYREGSLTAPFYVKAPLQPFKLDIRPDLQIWLEY
jgi:hypothetical protein